MRLSAGLVCVIRSAYDQLMASRTDLAHQQRHAQLRERQRDQRLAVDRVALALARVGHAEARQDAQEKVDDAARALALAKENLRQLTEAQRGTKSGSRLGTVAAERAAAGRELAVAVDAFGSVATAANALDMTERSIRGYLADHARAQTIDDPQ